jgi:excisionase family DNA binding protein
VSRMQTHTVQSHSPRRPAPGRPQPSDPAVLTLTRERAIGSSRLLAAEDVADVLGVPRTFVYALARRGALPTVRVGERYVRFRAQAVEEWIAEQETSRPRGGRR